MSNNCIVRWITIFLLTIVASLNLSDSAGVLVVGVLIVLYLFAFLINKNHRKKLYVSNTITFFIIWAMYAITQLLFVEQVNRTFSHLQSLMLGIGIIFLISRLVTEEKHFSLLYKLWGVTTFITIMIAWWEILTDKHLSGSGAVFYNLNHSATVGFFNPNDYSLYLVLCIPIIMHWIKLNGLYKLAGLFMLGSSFYIMIANGSRMAILVFIGVVGVFLLNLWVSKRKKLFAFFALSIGLASFVFRDVITLAVNEISTLNGTNNSVLVRNSLMESAMQIFKENPFGVGPGNVELYMPVVGYKVHNFWMEILVNYGIFIFVGLLLFFVIILWSFFKIRYKDAIMPIYWTTLIFIPACISSSSMFQQPILWFLLGLMVSAKTYIKNKKRRTDLQNTPVNINSNKDNSLENINKHSFQIV